jgi:beta-lactam-binding protein with PASTA domain
MVTGAAGGLVVSQDPASGNAVDPDQPISVTLGVATTSPSAVVVPDLHGLRVARARELTRSVGLKLVASSAAGYVQSQKPPAGTSVDANTTVTVTVRARVTVRFVVVPDLRGDSVDTARITLAGVGLALSSPATTGTVATQDLPPGRRVATGTIVTVTLELVASPTSSRTRSTPGWHWAVAAGAVLVLLASAGGITVRRLRRRRARPRPTAGPPPRVTCRATAAVVHTRSPRVPAPTVELRIREHATLTTERKP